MVVQVRTSSRLVVGVLGEWLTAWRENGWRRKGRSKLALPTSLLQQLDRARTGMHIRHLHHNKHREPRKEAEIVNVSMMELFSHQLLSFMITVHWCF